MFKIEPKPEGLSDCAMSLDNEAGEQEDKAPFLRRDQKVRKPEPRIIENTGVYGVLVRWEPLRR
jgi:hypothetical protein